MTSTAKDKDVLNQRKAVYSMMETAIVGQKVFRDVKIDNTRFELMTIWQGKKDNWCWIVKVYDDEMIWKRIGKGTGFDTPYKAVDEARAYIVSWYLENNEVKV